MAAKAACGDFNIENLHMSQRGGCTAFRGDDLAHFAIERVGVLRPGLNNSNPILIEGSPEEVNVRAAGWEIAFDGMEVAP